jgi:hypothetical protein
VGLLAGLFFLGPRQLARAQQAITLVSLQISIWPEFDRPLCLVILAGQLAPGVPLPAELTVHMPAAAQAPNAVAVVGADGGLLQVAYTTAAAGGDIIVKFTTNAAGFRVEYYDPALVISGDSRSYAFRWKSDYAVEAVGLTVQEPYGARNLSGQPVLALAGAGDFGLNYHTASLGALAAGGTVSLDLRYAKTGSVLSATAVGSAQSGTAGAPASTPIATAAGGTTRSLPWVLGSAALVLVGGGVAWYVRNKRPAQQGRAGRTARQGRGQRAEPARVLQTARKAVVSPAAATKGVATATLLDTAPASFCTQCGQRHQTGDRFCRQCGAPVRE